MAPSRHQMLVDKMDAGPLWRDTASKVTNIKPLLNDINVDFAIIGAGFTGCSAAFTAAKNGASVAVLEANRIGYGGSGRNVGLVNAGLWLAPDDVVKKLGAQAGEKLNSALAAAPDLVFGLINDLDISCSATRAGTLHCAHSKAGLRGLEQRLSQFHVRGAPVQLLDAKETSARIGSNHYHGALFDPRAGTIQPQAYVNGLAENVRKLGAQIYENSPVSKVQRSGSRWEVTANGHVVRAQYLLVATNAYHQDIDGHNASDTATVHYFQAASEPLNKAQREVVMCGGEGCWDTATIMKSFRLDDQGRLIFGAMGRLSGVGKSIHLAWLRRTIPKVFPTLRTLEFTHVWHGRISMTANHIPKLVSPSNSALAVLGYSGRGIGPGTILGQYSASHLLGLDHDDIGLQIEPQYHERFHRVGSEFYETAARATHLFSV